MIYIIGDSHTLRLGKAREYGPLENCNWDTYNNDDIVQKSECIDFHCTTSTINERKFIFSGHPGATGYTSSYSKGGFPCIKKEINKDTLIMPWFGYIDIKAHLPHEKNTEEAVSNYVKQTVSFFEGHKLQFIEPLPQFINAIGGGRPNYEFEERYPYYLEYLKILKQYLSDYNLNQPISIEKILNTDRLDESYECHECADCLSPRFINYKLDHLKKDFNKKILDGIIREVYNK